MQSRAVVYRMAEAEERLAFQALMDEHPQTNAYPRVFKRWQMATAAARAAQDAMLRDVPNGGGVESGGTG